MKKYIIYTVIEGTTYVICYTKEKNFFIQENPSDDIIAKWDTEADAQRIQNGNQAMSSVYKIKEIII